MFYDIQYVLEITHLSQKGNYVNISISKVYYLTQDTVRPTLELVL